MLLALLAVLFAVGLWRGWIAVHRRMIVPLAALALATIFMPEWAMGGWGVHMRLPAVLGALAFASVEFRLERNATRALAASAVLVLAYNAFALTRDWLAYDRQFAEFRAAARTLAPDARLMTVLDGDAIGYRSDQPYWHMAEFAIVERGAFTPLLFTTKTSTSCGSIRSGRASPPGPPSRARRPTSTNSTISPPAGSTKTRTSPMSFPI